MNRNQGKGHASEAKGKEVTGKVTDDESTKHKGKAGKSGSKDGTVLGEMNSGDAKGGTK